MTEPPPLRVHFAVVHMDPGQETIKQWNKSSYQLYQKYKSRNICRRPKWEEIWSHPNKHKVYLGPGEMIQHQKPKL
jgi:hypothetical protein